MGAPNPNPPVDPSDAAFAVNPDEGVNPQQPPPRADAVLGAAPFRDFPTEGAPPFINKRLSAAEFAAYCAGYQFGSIEPSRVVLHHTWKPRLEDWRGLSTMRGMQTYYAGLGWTSAPHIYAGPDGIWLATPMSRVGIHAGAGNGSVAQGWYSIGLEMVGDYDHKLPSGPTWANTLAALVALGRRLGRTPAELLAFHNDYTSAKSCPGRAVTKEWVLQEWLRATGPSEPAPTHRARLWAPVFEAPPSATRRPRVAWEGQAVLAPGQAIPLSPTTIAGWLHWDPNGFVEAAAVEPITARPAYTADSPLLGPTDDPDRAVEAFVAVCRAAGTPYRDDEVRGIAQDVVVEAVAVGLDAWLALTQILKETGGLTSFWSQPPQCNPAGLGVDGQVRPGEPDDLPPGPDWAYNPQRRQWEKGIVFRIWLKAIRAMLGRLLAYALPINTGTPAQQALINEALGVRPLAPIARGTAPTLKPLGAAHNPANRDRQTGALKPRSQWVAGWAWPGEDYGESIAERANRLRAA